MACPARATARGLRRGPSPKTERGPASWRGGEVISLPLIHTLSEVHITIPTALAAGTFIYVATMDLLPEAFHDTRKRLGPFIALSIGILVMLLVPPQAGLVTRLGG